MRRHLTYANVMSTLGVFLALAGGYAAAKITGDGAIKGGQVIDVGADRETLVTVPGLGKANIICTGDETRAAWKNTSGGRERVTVEFEASTISFLSQSGSSHEYPLDTAQPKLVFAADGRLVRRERSGSGAGRPTETYTYDRNGNRLTDERGSYRYNARDQLTRWTRNDSSVVTYVPDGSGAVTEKRDGAVTTTYDYVGDRLNWTQEGSDPRVFFDYNDFGSITCARTGTESCAPSSGDVRYEYDDFERRTGSSQEPATEYRYDALDRREVRSKDGVDYELSYVGTSELLSREADPSGRNRFYDYDSRGDRQGFMVADGATRRYQSYAKDARGSTEELENRNGSADPGSEYRYDPYGQLEQAGQISDPDARDNPFRFEGFYFDEQANSYDMLARTYEPDLGRFLNEDRFEQAGLDLALQADPLTQNRYVFVGGNPISRIEFDGHIGWEVAHVHEEEGDRAARRYYDNYQDTLRQYGLSREGGGDVTTSATSAVAESEQRAAITADLAASAFHGMLGQAEQEALMERASEMPLSELIAFEERIQATGDHLECQSLCFVEDVFKVVIGDDPLEIAATFVPFGKLASLGSKGIGLMARWGDEVPEAAKVAPAKRSTGTTVLGNDPAYRQLSDTLGARRFDVPADVWKRMTPAERWSANKRFLDRTIARGDDIVLATPINSIKSDLGYYAGELRYLASKGYRPNSSGTRMIPGGG